MRREKGIAVLGGTFDPIHKGHLTIANNLLEKLPISEVCFIPCKQTVLKPYAQASAQQRLAMMAIALRNHPDFVIDCCEIDRQSPSYSVETLLYLRTQQPNVPIFFVIGMDAFINLPQWHRWQEILELSHLIIVNREGSVIPKNEPLAGLIEKHLIVKSCELLERETGAILFLHIPPVLVSSTKIRNMIASGKDPTDYISKEVWRYIKDEQLYT